MGKLEPVQDGHRCVPEHRLSQGGSTLSRPHYMPHSVGRPILERIGPTILVVEDQEAVRSATTRALIRFGYQVLSAADGEEGLRIWRANADAIDLVLSDAMMPRMSGLALLEAIREEQPGIRFLLTSGDPGEEVRRNFLPTLAPPFLSKPWTLEDLLGAVREALTHPPA